MATETVEDLANKAISQREYAGEHPLELAYKAIADNNASSSEAQVDASWEHLPAEQRYAANFNAGV